MEEITSLDNPKVKLAFHLQDRRDRDKTALFLIEGYRGTSPRCGREATSQPYFYLPRAVSWL